jgi:hypothetical protein
VGLGKEKPLAKEEFKLSVHPNPADHLLMLELPIEMKGLVAHVELINTTGQKLKIWTPDTQLLHHIWNILDVSSGAYQVLLTLNDGSIESYKVQIIH